jgi:hypothetical protein
LGDEEPNHWADGGHASQRETVEIILDSSLKRSSFSSTRTTTKLKYSRMYSDTVRSICPLPIQVNPDALIPHCPWCEIEFPQRQKRAMITMQECTADVFAEDAAVLVLDKEMLAEARPELLVSGMDPNTYNTVGAVRGLPFLEKDVDPV